VYLNGTEIFRSPNMPGGTITYTTRASNTGENSIDRATGLPNLLVNGVNVVAVEMHQQAPDSSDLSFDLQLSAVPSGAAPPAPAGDSTEGLLAPIPVTTTTSGTINLGGRANVIDTRSVRVNGVLASFTAWQ